MWLKKHKNKIITAFIFLLFIGLILNSGCVKTENYMYYVVCSKTGCHHIYEWRFGCPQGIWNYTDDWRESLNPNIHNGNHINRACYDAIKIPKGYSFCLNDCDSKYTSLINPNFSYFPENLKNSLNDEFQTFTLIQTLASSSVHDLQNARNHCGAVWEHILSNHCGYNSATDEAWFRGYYNQYKTDLINFNNHTKKYIHLQLKNMFKIKTYLESERVDLIADSNIYKDYKNMMDLINIYQKGIYVNSLNLDKNQRFFNTYKFYEDFYKLDANSLKEIWKQSADFETCIIENKYWPYLCYPHTNTTSYWFFFNNYSNNYFLYNFLYDSNIYNQNNQTSLFNDIWQNTWFNPFFNLYFSSVSFYWQNLFGDFNQTDDDFTLTSNNVDNYPANIVSHATSNTINEWFKAQYGFNLFNEFREGYGPNSDIIFYYKTLSNISRDINALKEKIQNQKQEIEFYFNEISEKEKKEQDFYNKNHFLLEKFNIINFNPKAIIEKKKTEFEASSKYISSLGEKETYYTKTLNDLKLKYLPLFNQYYKDRNLLFKNCNAMINTIKNHNYDNKYKNYLITKKIQNYEKANDQNKLDLCQDIITSYAFEDDKTCIDTYLKFIKNTYQNNDFNYSEGCVFNIFKKIKEFENSPEYFELEGIFANIEDIKELPPNFCTNTRHVQYILDKLYNQNINTPFTNNDITKNLFFKDLNTYKKELYDLEKNKYFFLQDIFKCYFRQHYWVSKSESRLYFENIFGKQNTNFTIKLPIADLVLNINNDNCLDVKKENKDWILNFKCIKENMQYPISLLQYDLSFVNAFIDLNRAFVIEKACVLGTEGAKLVLPLPTERKNIISVHIDNTMSHQINDKLTLWLNQTYTNKKCFNIKYVLQNPVSVDYNYTITDLEKTRKVFFDIYIQNTLDYDLKNISIVIPFPFKTNYIRAYQNDKNFKALQNGKYIFIYKKLITKNKRDKINLLLKYNIDQNTNNNNPPNNPTPTLPANIYKPQNPTYQNPNKDLEKDKNSIDNAKQKEQKDNDKKYKQDITNDLNKLITKIQNLVDNGFIDKTKATKIIDKAKDLNKNSFYITAKQSLEDFLTQNSPETNLKSEYAKLSQEIKFNLKIMPNKDKQKEFFQTNQNIVYNFFKALKNKDFDNAKALLKEFKNLLNKITKENITQQKQKQKNIADLKTKIKQKEKEFNEINIMLLILENNTNNRFFDTIDKNKLFISKKLITGFKTKLFKLKTIAQELNDLNSFDYLNTAKAENFFKNIDKLKQDITKTIENLKTNASAKITYIAKVYDEKPIKYYKAKEAFEAKKYVEAIYYAKTDENHLNTKKYNKTIILLLVGLFAIFIIYRVLLNTIREAKENKRKRY